MQKSLFSLTYGLYIVTSLRDGKGNGQLSDAVMQVTDTPPRIAVSINKTELTHEYIDSSATAAEIRPLCGLRLVKRRGTHFYLCAFLSTFSYAPERIAISIASAQRPGSCLAASNQLAGYPYQPETDALDFPLP